MGVLILMTPTRSDKERRGKEKERKEKKKKGGKKEKRINFYLLADCPFVERFKLGMDKICGEEEPGTLEYELLHVSLAILLCLLMLFFMMVSDTVSVASCLLTLESVKNVVLKV